MAPPLTISHLMLVYKNVLIYTPAKKISVSIFYDLLSDFNIKRYVTMHLLTRKLKVKAKGKAT